MRSFLDRHGRPYYLETRQRAYRAIPREVLRDLAEFCRANESCFHDDPRRHALLEGRREVWNRIQNHIHLTEEQLIALTHGPER